MKYLICKKKYKHLKRFKETIVFFCLLFAPCSIVSQPMHTGTLCGPLSQHPHVQSHEYTNHQNESLSVNIETVFVGAAAGQDVFYKQFYPLVGDNIHGLRQSFQHTAGGPVWQKGCYSLAVSDADYFIRGIASSADMSSAPSLVNKRIPVGQGIALCPTGDQGPSYNGYLIIQANTAPLTAVGMQIYASPEDSRRSYPKVIAATLQLETGHLIDVEIAQLAEKKGNHGMPESRGYARNVSGYGFLGLKSSIPFTQAAIWFESENEAQNALYLGGDILLYAKQSLIYAPELPGDQLNVLTFNEYLYSSIALLPLDEQSSATEQVLGKNNIDQASQLASSASIISNMAGILINRDSGTFSGTLDLMPKKMKTWLQPIMMHQHTASVKSHTQGLWMGLDYVFSPHFSMGIFGGWTHMKTQLTDNIMGQSSGYAGLSCTGQWRSDDLGPSLTQWIVCSKTENTNIRSVPIFHYQAQQKYPGYSLCSISQWKWSFALPASMKITTYGLFSYYCNKTSAFQENISSFPLATSIEQILAQNAALQFNDHFASTLLQETGIMLKKQGDFLTSSAFNVWISTAIGMTQSLKQTPYQVGFVHFEDTFSVLPSKQSTIYIAPMMGLSFSTSSGWKMSVGGRFQKTIKTTSTDPAQMWSLWVMLQSGV